MPRVPISEQRIQYQTPNVPTPVKTPAPPEEAFGGGVAQARGNVGKAVSNLGETLSKYAIDLETRKSQKIANETINSFHDELFKTVSDTALGQDGRPKGFLRRQMNQAIGSSVEFDQTVEPIVKKYREMPMSPDLRNQLDEALKSKYGAMRESVFKHEQAETVKAEDAALDTRISNAVTMAGLAPDPIDLSNNISSEKGALAATMGKKGFSVDDIKAKGAALAGKMTEASVVANLETDPAKAALMLDLMQKKHGPLPNFTELTDKVNGKVLFDQQEAAWNQVATHRLSTGEIDMAYAKRVVESMPLPQERKNKIFAYVQTQASVADATLKNQRDAVSRSFTNTLVEDHSKGVPLDISYAKAVMAGWDQTQRATFQNEATLLYEGKQSSFDTWYAKQPEEIKGAVESSRQQIAGVYSPTQTSTVAGAKSVNLNKAMNTELEQQWIGKSASQIRDITEEKLKDVVTKKRRFWFDATETGWKVDAEVRKSYQAKFAQLEKDYGTMRVDQAKAKLAANKVPITPDNTKKFLDTVAGNP